MIDSLVSPVGFIILDPFYFIVIGPFFLLSLFAAWKVKSTFARMNEQPAFSGMTGYEVAQDILIRHNIQDVRIEESQGGHLSDHYDPRDKVVRLSPEVFHGRSVSALGVAAHELGHVLQDKQGYAPLAFRNAIVPFAGLGGNLGVILVIIGIVIGGAASVFGAWLLWAGIALFSATVLFQLINLPVEFNASSRAREMLVADGMISPQEDAAVGKVLNAAALTYVAATLTAVATLAYYVFLAFASRE